MTEATGNLLKWQLRISELDFEVVDRNGVKYQPADVLSRLPTTESDESLFEDDVPVPTKTGAPVEGESTDMDANFWRNLPCNQGSGKSKM